MAAPVPCTRLDTWHPCKVKEMFGTGNGLKIRPLYLFHPLNPPPPYFHNSSRPASPLGTSHLGDPQPLQSTVAPIIRSHVQHSSLRPALAPFHKPRQRTAPCSGLQPPQRCFTLLQASVCHGGGEYQRS